MFQGLFYWTNLLNGYDKCVANDAGYQDKMENTNGGGEEKKMKKKK